MLRLDALEIEGAEHGADCGLVGAVQNLAGALFDRMRDAALHGQAHCA
jgi:hypothetical protein